MSTIRVAAACLCALCLTLQASHDNCDHPTVHEVVPGKEHGHIRSVGAPSMYDCAAECQLLPQCLFFTFDPEKRACQLLRKTNPSFTVGSGIFFSNIQEWKTPLTGACRKASCSPNAQCAVGRNGHSLCSSYIDCKSYGDTMTPYKELAISGHNRKVLYLDGEMEDAMMKCMSACVEETSFVCKTVDFRALHPKCHLSSEGYLDVAVEKRERDQFNWWFAVRKCE